MKATTVMLIAGEPSGDLLAAELMKALKQEFGNPRASRPTPHAPATFFGAGGAKMAEAGVELAFDMTQHSVIGLWEALKNYRKFKRLFDQLVSLAFERRPDVIVCVDFSGFNRRFARKIRWELAVRRATDGDWRPKIVQYVSPQVWASRPGRAKTMARDFDLLLSIFPFEKPWYMERVPELKVEFVGNPAADRFHVERSTLNVERSTPTVLLLPGSRVGELKRHLPVMYDAVHKMVATKSIDRPFVFKLILPNQALLDLADEFDWPANTVARVGGLEEALKTASIAIASTGTVTMECAFFGVPTIALYKTSWSTYQIGKRIIQVKYLAMPNLLANEAIFPEFIQQDATAENIARAALELLNDAPRREAIRTKLAKIVESLGGPGASQRAGQAIAQLMR